MLNPLGTAHLAVHRARAVFHRARDEKARGRLVEPIRGVPALPSARARAPGTRVRRPVPLDVSRSDRTAGPHRTGTWIRNARGPISGLRVTKGGYGYVPLSNAEKQRRYRERKKLKELETSVAVDQADPAGHSLDGVADELASDRRSSNDATVGAEANGDRESPRRDPEPAELCGYRDHMAPIQKCVLEAGHLGRHLFRY